MAGNFNMTNVDELFDLLVQLGQHPKEKTDTVTVMEKIGHFVDEENQRIFDKYRSKKENFEITQNIESEMNIQRILKRSFKDFEWWLCHGRLTGPWSFLRSERSKRHPPRLQVYR